MIWRWFAGRGRTGGHSLLLTATFLALLASRRWQQIISPQVWCEDGSHIFAGFVRDGWLSLAEPVNGYFVTIPRILSAISLSVSVTAYPLLSTLLAWLFTATVGLATAILPTKLRTRQWCAVAMFAIPSDPECFGVPLYTFWWSAVLLFLLTIWDEQSPDAWRRSAIALVCGLSSPVVIIVLPVLFVRAYWLHPSSRAEKTVIAVATIAGLIQVFCILSTDSGSSATTVQQFFQSVIPLFFGWFLIGNLSAAPVALWLAGSVVAAAIAVWWWQQRHSFVAGTLVYLLAACILLSAVRVPLDMLHPRDAGPRYFFLPFILSMWILIQAAMPLRTRNRLSIVACASLGLAFINAGRSGREGTTICVGHRTSAAGGCFRHTASRCSMTAMSRLPGS